MCHGLYNDTRNEGWLATLKARLPVFIISMQCKLYLKFFHDSQPPMQLLHHTILILSKYINIMTFSQLSYRCRIEMKILTTSVKKTEG